jgi:trk system potassium uptake protein
MKSGANISRLEGALMALSPLLLVLSFLGIQSEDLHGLRTVLSILAALLCFLCALTIFRRPLMGKLFGAGAAFASYGAIFSYFSDKPFAALAGSVSLIYLVSVLLDFGVRGTIYPINHAESCLQRTRWATFTVPVVAAILTLFPASIITIEIYVAASSSVIAQSLFLHWAITIKSKLRITVSVIGISAIALLLPLLSTPFMVGLIGLLSISNLLMMPRYQVVLENEEHWWEILVNHPGRILFTTFFSLCFLGSILLSIPASTEKGEIAIIDSVFTSVSAVCVTGLIVLDTPSDFTVLGQVFILFLIQLGGLGIMSITTVALHALGRRLSLKHERLLASMTDTSHHDLIRSIATILKFTFVMEGLGALLLSMSFYFSGDQLGLAIWRGLFTAVSAFCNAGFALQSNSLIPYQTNPLVLNAVATLIVFGGLAPATSLVVPRWATGKPIPIPAKIALITSVVLLTTGTFFVLAFEWNGVLAGLSLADKLQNAWFQSVTLRTAGFNSVDIVNISSPTFLIMVTFMFIGGSPGGTAGGVKTTTIGILAMTFWSIIANKDQIIIQNRRIHPGTIYRGLTVVLSGIAIWFLVIIMLEVTQNISPRDLIFEATSAIGTVGLSAGATPLLDEIGKVIVIIAMFVGRIGPISLFMLLNDEQTVSDTRYPVERVSIT